MSNANARLQVRENTDENAWKDVGHKAGNLSLPITIVADDVGIGGGTQYAEDSVHTSGHLGTMALAVRNTASALAATGDYTPLSTDNGGNLRTSLYSGNAEIASIADGGDGSNNTSRGLRMWNRNEVFNGTTWDRLRGDVRGVHISDIKDSAGDSLIDAANNALQVNIVAGAAAGGTSALDDADFTAGATAGTPVMGAYQSTPTAVTDGDLGIVGIDADRNLKVNIVAGSSSGTEYTEDVATANPIVGSATMIERDDALSVVTPIEGDWIGLRGSAEGALWVQDFNSDAILADTTTLAGAIKAEDAAHTSGDVGVMALAVRNDNWDSIVTADGDYAPIQVTETGAVRVVLDPNTFTLRTSVDAQKGASGGDITALSGTVGTDKNASIPVQQSAYFRISGTWVGTLEFQVSIDGTNFTSIYARKINGGVATSTTENGEFLIPASVFHTIRVIATAWTSGTAVVAWRTETGLTSVAVTTPVTIEDGGNTITVDGTVTANLSATDNAVLDQIELNTDPLLVVGGGVEATAQRVTIANDSTGVLSVDDNGGSLTVDGAVTANAGTNLNTSALALETTATSIKTAVEIIDNAIAGTEMQVDVVAALPAGANNIGDVDVLTLPGDTVADIGALESDTDSSTMWADGAEVVVKRAVISAATSGDNTLVAAVVGKNIRVISLFLVALSEVAVRFESGAAGTALSGIMTITDHSGLVLPENKGGWFETADNTLLNLELGGAIQVSGSLTYIEI